MNNKIKLEWPQEEARNNTKQVAAFVLNKDIIHAATQTSESYRREFQLPVPNEIATREMYDSFAPEQQDVVMRTYNKNIRTTKFMNENHLKPVTEYYGKLVNLAHNLEEISASPQARDKGATENQTAQHHKTKMLVIDTFVALIKTLLDDVYKKDDFIKQMLQTAELTLDETSIDGTSTDGRSTDGRSTDGRSTDGTLTLVRKSSTKELLDTVSNHAEILRMHFPHETKPIKATIRLNARDSQALLKECVLEVNQMAQKATKEKEKRGYYFGGGRTL